MKNRNTAKMYQSNKRRERI